MTCSQELTLAGPLFNQQASGRNGPPMLKWSYDVDFKMVSLVAAGKDIR